MNRKTLSLGGLALRSLILALCILPAAGVAVAGAAELTPRQLKKNLKEAEKAWNAGRTAAAVELYEGILDATEPGDPHRADALYAVGLASLADDPGRAGKLLAELVEKFPRHPSSGTAKVITGLLSELDGARAESSRLTKELESRKDDLEASQSSATELAELREKLAQAESKLAAAQDARSQLAKKDKEIADCEEKLKKVRETLVGGGGP